MSPICIESSECLLLVNICGESVVWAAFNENVQKRNIFGLFKFNGKFEAIVTAVEVKNSVAVSLLSNIEKVSSTYLYQRIG